MRTSPVNLRISDRGLALIAEHEGSVLHAYDDADPSHRPIKEGDAVHGTLTIGSGHTRTVVPGMVINDAVRLSLLRSDVREAESHIHRNVTCPLSQNEFDALVSLVFNVGPGQAGGKSGIITLANGQPSSLLKCLNGIDTPDGKPDYVTAATWFTAWRQTRGFEYGLFRRRISEMLLFMGLPWTRALNACRNLQFTIAEAVGLAREELADLVALRGPAPKPSPAATRDSPAKVAGPSPAKGGEAVKTPSPAPPVPGGSSLPGGPPNIPGPLPVPPSKKAAGTGATVVSAAGEAVRPAPALFPKEPIKQPPPPRDPAPADATDAKDMVLSKRFWGLAITGFGSVNFLPRGWGEWFAHEGNRELLAWLIVIVVGFALYKYGQRKATKSLK